MGNWKWNRKRLDLGRFDGEISSREKASRAYQIWALYIYIDKASYFYLMLEKFMTEKITMEYIDHRKW